MFGGSCTARPAQWHADFIVGRTSQKDLLFRVFTHSVKCRGGSPQRCDLQKVCRYESEEWKFSLHKLTEQSLDLSDHRAGWTKISLRDKGRWCVYSLSVWMQRHHSLFDVTGDRPEVWHPTWGLQQRDDLWACGGLMQPSMQLLAAQPYRSSRLATLANRWVGGNLWNSQGQLLSASSSSYICVELAFCFCASGESLGRHPGGSRLQEWSPFLVSRRDET